MRDGLSGGMKRRALSGRLRPLTVLLGACVFALPQAALGAVPALSTAKTAVPAATCQEAQVTLTVNGVGDPVTQRLPLDVVIVFDRSGSMDDAGGNPKQPITDAKNAAIALISQLNNATDTAGLTSFATTASLDQGLTSNFATVSSKINAISVSGDTNIGAGVKTGQQEISSHGRTPPAVHVMVVLTDGVANRTANNGSCSTSPTASDACTQDAVNQAAAAKNSGTIIFTIGLNLDNLGSQTAAVARAELEAMASNNSDYYEAPTSSQLASIFSQIATVITNLAGTNILVTDILPAGVQYVAGSASPAPLAVAGQTLTWNLGLLDIGGSSSATFLVTFDSATPNQLVDVFPDSRINYDDYQGNPAAVPFPETHVTVPG
ncbi:MAG: VWA domain-containing protein, partial [Mycobacteriales bacterium]